MPEVYQRVSELGSQRGHDFVKMNQNLPTKMSKIFNVWKSNQGKFAIEKWTLQ